MLGISQLKLPNRKIAQSCPDVVISRVVWSLVSLSPKKLSTAKPALFHFSTDQFVRQVFIDSEARLFYKVLVFYLRFK